VQDIKGNLSLAGILEFLQLREILEGFHLQDRADKHVWRFTSKSACRAFFISAVVFLFLSPGKGSGRVGRPLNASYSFGLLLIINDGLQTMVFKAVRRDKALDHRLGGA
jgi:hypothetical protein